jgi:AraC-like DNA-binding protein
MGLIRYTPKPPLGRFIEHMWWSRRDQPQSDCEHMLPSGSAQMVFLLHDSPVACLPARRIAPQIWSRALLHGPQQSFYISGPKPRGVSAGISFRPGAAGAILGVPLSELTDLHVPLDDLWGSRGDALHERLLAASDSSAVFRIIEDELLSRLRRPLLIHPAIAEALRAGLETIGSIRVAQLQRAAGYSPRHFASLFRTDVGLTPKRYFRLQRLKAALRNLAVKQPENLAELAVITGYSDQSHMTREFRELAGITPTQYAPRGPDSVLHHRMQRQWTELQLR